MAVEEKARYVVMTKVEGVQVHKDNNNSWIHFDGSQESMAFPKDAFAVGDKIKITFEKVD